MHLPLKAASDCAHAKVLDGGRIILPAEMRRSMQVKPGDTVVLKLDGDQLTVSSLQSVIKRMQDKYRQAPGQPSAVDALIAERRREAQLEEEGR